ncbi:hypothetical protein CGCF415_v006132 [Colletotrichum fructicola]|nr:hypothetical protein CGCF415_v006132 [Colletotrichum fructicola]KAF4928212.1 hypothetical protein CGCF245_v012748 [Colletotrichum fructicola]
MDPITAVALAGNILQFVQFIGGLLDNTRSLYSSETGTSPDNDHLEGICGRLIAFDINLSQNSSSRSGQTHIPSRLDRPLNECAAACKQDCESLLRILNGLKVVKSRGPKSWNSFQAALREVWKTNDIEKLKQRIVKHQREMTLLLSAITSEGIKILKENITDISKTLRQLYHDSSSGPMMTEIQNLKDHLSLYSGRERRETSRRAAINTCEEFSELSSQTLMIKRQTYILRSLDYKERSARHSYIPIAHSSTFDWSLQNGHEPESKYGVFQRWLTDDRALFWVSGKPGSGKSTFMKYVADHHQTRGYLETWSSARDLLIVSHYFTIHGSPIQRSLNGLLRSLLFSILIQKPLLIPKFMPNRCEQLSVEHPSTQLGPWTQAELQAILKRIGADQDELPARICFFIDGLDEYDGDHIDICHTLKELSQNPFVKVCVSSRPWNVFEDALGGDKTSKLYMQELSRRDIWRYTSSCLKSHARWNMLLRDNGSEAVTLLVEDVVNRSNGVWLWVVLVVRLLQEGLTNDDSMYDLERRLHSFPSDLYDFFWHVLVTVDPFYNEKMAGTLSLALEADEPQPLEIYFYHDFEYEDEGFALRDPSQLLPIDPAELGTIFDRVARRINGRCKGLLERDGNRIGFLHRTVYDFLHTKEMADFLNSHLRDRVHARITILRAYLAWIKHTNFLLDPEFYSDSSFEDKQFRDLVKQALPHARLADQQGGILADLTTILLDNLDDSIAGMVTRGQLKTENPSHVKTIFRHIILEEGLEGYLLRKLALDPNFLRNTYGDRLHSPQDVLLYPECKLSEEGRMRISRALEAAESHAVKPQGTMVFHIYWTLWRWFMWWVSLISTKAR